MRSGVVAIAFLAGAAVAVADPPPKGSGKRVAFDVHHVADGKRYPNAIDEHYELSRDGSLYYEAHFSGIATGHNSNDVADWNAGASAAAAVFDAVDRSAGDLVGESTNGYLVTFEGPKKKVELVRFADKHGKAYPVIDPPFQAVVQSFEKAKGRPLKPDQLEHP